MISSVIGRVLSSFLIFGTIGGGSYGAFLALSNSNENRKIQINKDKQEIERKISDNKEQSRTINEKRAVNLSPEAKTFNKEEIKSKLPKSFKKDGINNLLLEVIWSKRNSKTKLPEDYCFLLSEEEANIQTIDMKEKIKSDNFDEENKGLCQRIRNTTPTEDKQLKDSWEEAFWIEGYKGKVEEFINKNLSGFLNDAGFANNNLTPSNSHLSYFKELLNNSCSEVVNDAVPWAIEVTCIKKNNSLMEGDQFIKT